MSREAVRHNHREDPAATGPTGDSVEIATEHDFRARVPVPEMTRDPRQARADDMSAEYADGNSSTVGLVEEVPRHCRRM